MRGGRAGLADVPSESWGGLPLTFLLSTVGFAAAFPFGGALALGRRSTLPAIRALSIAYIELIRGVPLVTVLFMAAVMFPLFVPQGFTIDKLLRAQIAFVMVIAAYLAEVVRGGLQAIPKGQYEAAASLGLAFWPATILVVLPQALRITIPALVNTFIALLQGHVAGRGDRAVRSARRRQGGRSSIRKWVGFGVEVYLFVAAVYFTFCYAVSRYSRHLEHMLMAPSVPFTERTPCFTSTCSTSTSGTATSTSLRDINLQVTRGERVVICGPSGSGKSTLIRCINRLETTSRADRRRRRRADRRSEAIDDVRRDVGMVFQQFNLFPHLTILENCTLAPIWVKKMPRRDAEAMATHYLRPGQDRRAGRTSTRVSSRAASSSARRSRARCA